MLIKCDIPRENPFAFDWILKAITFGAFCVPRENAFDGSFIKLPPIFGWYLRISDGSKYA
jgi:hypothetical protein